MLACAISLNFLKDPCAAEVALSDLWIVKYQVCSDGVKWSGLIVPYSYDSSKHRSSQEQSIFRFRSLCVLAHESQTLS